MLELARQIEVMFLYISDMTNRPIKIECNYTGEPFKLCWFVSPIPPLLPFMSLCLDVIEGLKFRHYHSHRLKWRSACS